MSSFTAHHSMYLFAMKNGKKKLAYGETPDDALKTLSYRLVPDEMSEIIQDEFVKVSQKDLQKYVPLLG